MLQAMAVSSFNDTSRNHATDFDVVATVTTAYISRDIVSFAAFPAPGRS